MTTEMPFKSVLNDDNKPAAEARAVCAGGGRVSAEVIENLDRAAFVAPYSGLYGASPALYYHALSANALSSVGRFQAWNGLVTSAQKSRNAAVLVRALFDARRACEDGAGGARHINEETWADLMMIQGHLLRRVAKDYTESARAYAEAARSSRNNALAANIALMRIHRADPQCEEIRAALQSIRDARLLRFESKAEIEKRLAQIDPSDIEKRAQTKIELATAILLDWGDVATALDWLEDAKPAPRSPSRFALIGIAYAIARACLDHRPTVARAVHVLDENNADLEIANTAILSLYIQTPPSYKDDVDFIFARVCSTERNRCDLACAFLHKAVLGVMTKSVSHDWMAIWMTQTWVFDCAKAHPGFAETILQFVGSIDDVNAELYLLENLQGVVSGGQKAICYAMRIERLCATHRYQEGLRLFEAALKDLDFERATNRRILLDVFTDLSQDPAKKQSIVRFSITARAFLAAAKSTPFESEVEALAGKEASDNGATTGRQNTLDIHGLIDELSGEPATFALAPLRDTSEVAPEPQDDSLCDLFGASASDLWGKAAGELLEDLGGLGGTPQAAGLPGATPVGLAAMGSAGLAGATPVGLVAMGSGGMAATATDGDLKSRKSRTSGDLSGLDWAGDVSGDLSGLDWTGDVSGDLSGLDLGRSAKSSELDSTPQAIRAVTHHALNPATARDASSDLAKPPSMGQGRMLRSGVFKPPMLQMKSQTLSPKASNAEREGAFRRCLASAAQGDWKAACATFFESCIDFDQFDDTMAKCVDLADMLLPSVVAAGTKLPLAAPWHAEQPHRNSITALALAYFVDPEQRGDVWREWIVQIADRDEGRWSIVVETWLAFLSHGAPDDGRIGVFSALVKKHPNSSKAAALFAPYTDIVFQNEALFDQVLNMSDAINQRQMLEKLDDAIAMYEGDTVQQNALIAKKYKIAELLGDERIKLTCLRDILETTPNDPFATEQLRKLDPDQLKSHAQILYYQLLIYIDVNQDVRLQHQMMLASIYAKSSQVNNAINLYDAILDEHPDCLEARYQILNLFESLENWKSAENALLALINEEPSPSMRVQCLVRLADIQNIHMRMPMRALLTLFAAIDADPAKISLLHNKMCDICEQSKSYAALLDKYEDMAVHAKSYDVRRIAIVLLANICAERINKPVLACNLLDEFFEREGKDDPDFLKVVANFYAEVKHWESYCKVTTALLQRTDDGEDKAQIALSIADVQENQLRDLHRAAQYARLAAQAGSTHADVWQDIAHYLLQIDAIQDAIDALNQAEALESNHDKKITILFEMTRLNTQIDNLTDAVAAFSRLSALRPPLENLTPIAEDLIALATVHKDRDAFVSLCNDLVNACPKIEQPALLLQQALTLIRVFDDIQSARIILASNKSNFDNIDPEQAIILAEILTRLGETQAAIDTIQNALNYFTLSEADTVALLEFLLQNAVALEDIDLIRTTADKILQIDAENVVANYNLIRLDYRTGLWDEAAQRIHRFLVHLDELTPEDATELHYEYGVILHAAQNPNLAIECLDNALRIEANFKPAVDLKLTILLENQRWPEALPLFQHLLTLAGDEDEQGAIHKRIAEVYHFYLHDDDDAIRHYEIALALGGDVEDVPVRLLELYIKTQSWQKAAMTAQVLAMAQTASPRARASYLAILADIQANHLGDISNATNALLEAFVLEPLHRDILRPLVKLLLQQSDVDNIRAIVDNIAKHIDDDASSNDEQSETAQSALTWMASAIEFQCHKNDDDVFADLLKYLYNVLQKHHIAYEPHTNPSDSAFNPYQSAPRNRIPSAPQTQLTIDSSLLRNPEIQQKQNSPSIVKTPVDDSKADNKPVGNTTATKPSNATATQPISQTANISNHADKPSQPNTAKSSNTSDNLLKSNVAESSNASDNSSKSNVAESSNTSDNLLKSNTSTKSPAKAEKPVLPNNKPSVSKIDHFKTSSVFNSLVVPIPSMAGRLKSSIQAIENLTFTDETLVNLYRQAKDSNAYFNMICLSEVLDICAQPHDELQPRPLPKSLPTIVRQNLFAERFQGCAPALLKLMQTMGQDEFPLIETVAIDDAKDDALTDEVGALHEQLTQLLDSPKTRLGTTNDSSPKIVFAHSAPLTILCPAHKLHSHAAWVAYLTFALSLARPESRLTATFMPPEIHTWMTQCADVMSILRAKQSELAPETQAAVKSALNNGGMTSATMPRITHDTLAVIHQIAAFNRKVAIQNALLFSQSFLDCLQILTDFEGLRFPTSIPSLKAAMKQSNAIRDFVKFAFDAKAQKTFSRIFEG